MIENLALLQGFRADFVGRKWDNEDGPGRGGGTPQQGPDHLPALPERG